MSTDQSPAAIFPPRFPAGIAPVISDPVPPPGIPLFGLPQSSFVQVTQRDGAVLIEIDPPYRGNSPEEDYVAIELWIQKLTPVPSDIERVERKAVPEPDRNKITSFHLYQSLLSDSAVYAVTYKVERGSGNFVDSIPTWTMYSRDLPGGNEIPGSGDHPNLNISLPAEFGEPPHIGFEDVDKGVPVTVDYPFSKAYDVIALELNRERFNFTVQPSEAGRPYVITITRDMFERAAPDPQCLISYTVVSQLNNPTHQRRWSKTIKANVDMANHRAPDLIEDPDAPGDTPGVIDRDKLNGRDLIVHYDGKDAHWLVGDHTLVKYTSTLNGSVVSHEVRGDVQQVPFVHNLTIPNAKIILGSKVEVFYQHWRGNSLIDNSPTVTETVVGSAMHAPDLIEDLSLPNDNPATIELSKLRPDGLNYLVHLEVSDDWRPTDVLKITYESTLNGTVETHTEQRQLPANPIPSLQSFKVPTAKIKLGSSVKAFYQKVRNGGILATSLIAEAVVVAGEVINTPPTIVSAHIMNTGAPVAPGESVKKLTWVILTGTCDSHPISRSMLIRITESGGYSIHISPYTPTWTCQVSSGAISLAPYYAEDKSGLRSNKFPINWID